MPTELVSTVTVNRRKKGMTDTGVSGMYSVNKEDGPDGASPCRPDRPDGRKGERDRQIYASNLGISRRIGGGETPGVSTTAVWQAPSTSEKSGILGEKMELATV